MQARGTHSRRRRGSSIPYRNTQTPIIAYQKFRHEAPSTFSLAAVYSEEGIAVIGHVRTLIGPEVKVIPQTTTLDNGQGNEPGGAAMPMNPVIEIWARFSVIKVQ